MGGNAFRAVLAASACPRMPPAVYRNLKTRLLSKLQDLYSHVAVPIEAPEKLDYGDLDFAVAIPKIQTSEYPSNSSVNVPHQVTLRALGATHMVPMDGNRTSHFAVPIQRGEWRFLGHEEEEGGARQLSESGELFYQVDVHVCSSVSEWEIYMFSRSYGDLLLILADAFGSRDLKLSEKGLYLKIAGHPPFSLSVSLDKIMDFIDLSMEPWRAGFSTKQEIFEWVASSHLFDIAALKLGTRKVKPDRKMYWQFIEWVKDGGAYVKSVVPKSIPDQEDREERDKRLQDLALDFFGKREEFDALQRELDEKIVKAQARKSYNGTIVGEWTGLTGKWLTVKKIMDKVRERVGGDQATIQMMQNHGEEELKAIVIEVAKELTAPPLSTEGNALEALSVSLGNASFTSSLHVDRVET
ncbi:hypothetical protein BDQ17DRAFT_1419451 [Cyathus striatus]|nr:hypothetical protein BDQ17DRAFT_1419451 [Cyathus striatus]